MPGDLTPTYPAGALHDADGADDELMKCNRRHVSSGAAFGGGGEYV